MRPVAGGRKKPGRMICDPYQPLRNETQGRFGKRLFLYRGGPFANGPYRKVKTLSSRSAISPAPVEIDPRISPQFLFLLKSRPAVSCARRGKAVSRIGRN